MVHNNLSNAGMSSQELSLAGARGRQKWPNQLHSFIKANKSVYYASNGMVPVWVNHKLHRLKHQAPSHCDSKHDLVKCPFLLKLQDA